MAALTRFHDAVLNNNVEVAKKLIDDGLDLNATLEVCRCPNSCDGYTLLYMACVHDRMTIVKMLLAAGADPDKWNRKDDIFNVNTPFVFGIKQRNHNLARVLMRESNVRAYGRFVCHDLFHSRVPYGLFCEFHENEAVIKVLLGGESNGARHHFYGNLANLLHGAAKHRSLEVCKVLLDHCGVKILVSMFMEREDWTEAMLYLIDVYGARECFEEEQMKESVMVQGSTGMLELLMGHFYQLYGDNKEWWTEQIMTRWLGKYPPSSTDLHYMYYIAISTFSRHGKSKFDCLLRWGVYSVLSNTKTVFGALVKSGKIESASVLVSLYPQCLQEEWLRMECKPWTGVVRSRAEREVEEYFATLVEKRRHAPQLQILCRSVIFHNLGINPIPKAECLPLPRILKDFAQCKELFETDV